MNGQPLVAERRHLGGLLEAIQRCIYFLEASRVKLRWPLATSDWQLWRATRNLAARAYETDYGVIAEHFNTLHVLIPPLYRCADRFIDYCCDTLCIYPLRDDFAEEFKAVTRQAGASGNVGAAHADADRSAPVSAARELNA